MKKLIILLTLSLIGLGQGCRTQHYIITDIRFNLAELLDDKHNDKERRNYDCSTTVKDRLIFVVSYETEFVVQNHLPNLGNTCYALTRPRKLDNPLEDDTFSLSFDQPFEYNGKLITAGTNVFAVDHIRSEIDIYENALSFCGLGADRVIEFSQSFFNSATFNSDQHTVTFRARTTDGLVFTKETVISFE